MAVLDLVRDAENGGTATTSATVTLGASPTVGNTLVFVCGYRSDRTLTPPTGFTTLTEKAATTQDSNNLDVRISFRVVQSGDGTAYAFTLDASGFLAAWVGEYQGVLEADKSSGSYNGGATSLTSGTTATTTAADEVAIAGWGHRNVATARGYTNTFVEQSYGTYGASVCSLHVADKRLTSAAAIETTSNWTTSSQVTSAIGTLKQVAGSTVTGSAALGLTLSTATAGVAIKRSTTALPVALAVATAGAHTKHSTVGLPIALGVATAGAATKQGTAALSLTLTTQTAGTLIPAVRGSASLDLAFSAGTAGSALKRSTVATPLTLSVAISGFALKRSTVALPLTLAVSTSGTATRVFTGRVSLELITFGFGSGGFGGDHYGSGVHGYVLKRTAVSLPITVGVDSVGARKAVGSVGLPITLAVATSGTARAVKSASASLAIAVDVSTSGFKTTSGVVALPLAFAVATNAVRTINGVVALPLTLAIATGGATPRRGSASLVLVFNVVADTTTIVFLEPIETGHIGFGGRARIEEAERGVLVR